jgi:uncharacterized membrane protein YhaH (DUF805 family)
MGFSAAIKTCFSKYAAFSGRARRPEYWWFFLFIVIGSIAATMVDGVIFGFGTPEAPATQVVSPIFSLATILPVFAAGWRRMHDTGRPGWYLLIPLGVSIGTMLGLMLGVFGFGTMEAARVDEETLRGAASGLGMAGIAIMGIVQLIVSVLVIWWLTRPTQAGANQYGEEP